MSMTEVRGSSQTSQQTRTGGKEKKNEKRGEGKGVILNQFAEYMTPDNHPRDMTSDNHQRDMILTMR